MTDRRWRYANTLLFTAIILVNLYTIGIPFVPSIQYWWQQRNGSRSTELTKRIEHPEATSSPQTKDSRNQASFRANAANNGLIIPRITLETPLLEGAGQSGSSPLDNGAWRLPFSASPDEGGNTVIAGHRFSYTGPGGVFYHLDKLRIGDDIGLWYQGAFYRYIVSSSRVHNATDAFVQEPTEDTRLTLYTCTPLWNPVKRLVVVATPVTETEKPAPPLQKETR